jgi:hypothetical protein
VHMHRYRWSRRCTYPATISIQKYRRGTRAPSCLFEILTLRRDHPHDSTVSSSTTYRQLYRRCRSLRWHQHHGWLGWLDRWLAGELVVEVLAISGNRCDMGGNAVWAGDRCGPMADRCVRLSFRFQSLSMLVFSGCSSGVGPATVVDWFPTTVPGARTSSRDPNECWAAAVWDASGTVTPASA